jgi:hypothetical protein
MYALPHLVDAFTYTIMGASLVGAVLARRFAFEPTTFIFTFLAAPTMAFIQKKEGDTLYFSEFSKYRCLDVGATPPYYCNSTPCSTSPTSRSHRKSTPRSPTPGNASGCWRSTPTATPFDPKDQLHHNEGSGRVGRFTRGEVGYEIPYLILLNELQLSTLRQSSQVRALPVASRHLPR